MWSFVGSSVSEAFEYGSVFIHCFPGLEMVAGALLVSVVFLVAVVFVVAVVLEMLAVPLEVFLAVPFLEVLVPVPLVFSFLAAGFPAGSSFWMRLRFGNITVSVGFLVP